MSRLGIIVALPAEAKSLYGKKLNVGLPIEIQKDIFLCLSGIGYDSAQIAAKKLLALKADALISWGVAGAIDSNVKSGDLILAKTIINENNRYAISVDWLARVSTHLQQSPFTVSIGDIASSTKICATTADKNALSKLTGAVAVDMESTAIAEVAAADKLDFLVIRTIADNANTAIPEAVLKHTDNLGQPKIFDFMLSCLLQPTQIKELSRLASGYKMGLKTLSVIAKDLKNEHFFHSAA